MIVQTSVAGRIVRRFTSPPEAVFDAWLEPAKASRFLFATAAGRTIALDLDPRVGGRLVAVESGHGRDVEHTGEYLDIDRPHRLAFSLSAQKYGRLSDRVLVEITPLPTGCELLLTLEMSGEWIDAKDRLDEEEEWAGVLVELDAILA